MPNNREKITKKKKKDLRGALGTGHIYALE